MTSPTWMGWKSAGVEDEDILLYPSWLLESCAVRKVFRRAVVLLYIRWLTEPAVNIRAEGPRKKAEVRGRTGMSARLLSHRLRLPYTSLGRIEAVSKWRMWIRRNFEEAGRGFHMLLAANCDLSRTQFARKPGHGIHGICQLSTLPAIYGQAIRHFASSSHAASPAASWTPAGSP